jgi:hypothetical protein
MTDHFPFIRFKGAFTFGIQRGSLGGRVRGAVADRIPEELEDIVVLQLLETVTNQETIRPTEGGIDQVADGGVDTATAAVLYLAERIKIEKNAAKHCHNPYHNILPQATDRVKC